jgi:hypothetical protein
LLRLAVERRSWYIGNGQTNADCIFFVCETVALFVASLFVLPLLDEGSSVFTASGFVSLASLLTQTRQEFSLE